MARLHQLKKLCWLAAIVLSSALAASAQDYCSLTVRVSSPDGRTPEVAVSVEEKGGRVLEHDPAFGDAAFCDLGGSPVVVKVGLDGTCNQVIVREVPVSWRSPYLLHVTFDPAGCNLDLPQPPVPVCRIVFRVSSSHGTWISGARIAVSKPVPLDLRTDKFGRASLVVKRGDEASGIVSDGGESKRFGVSCARGERVHDERLMLDGNSGK